MTSLLVRQSLNKIKPAVTKIAQIALKTLGTSIMKRRVPYDATFRNVTCCVINIATYYSKF